MNILDSLSAPATTRRFDAYLFDMDGTLVETEWFFALGLSQLLANDGDTLSPEECFKIISGRSWNDIYRDICERFPSQAIYSTDEQADRLKAYQVIARAGHDLSIPGSADVFRALAKHGPCAIVSGSRREDIQEAVELLHLQDAITLAIGAQDCPRGKPAPDGYLMAAKALHVDPARCVVFEDSLAGVLSGKAAGMFVIALVPPNAPDLGLDRIADLCVSSLLEIPSTVLP